MRKVSLTFFFLIPAEISAWLSFCKTIAQERGPQGAVRREKNMSAAAIVRA